MLYFPYGRTQAYTVYRWNGTAWDVRRRGHYLIAPQILQDCQRFLSLWLNKNVKTGTSNGVNADLAIGSQVTP